MTFFQKFNLLHIRSSTLEIQQKKKNTELVFPSEKRKSPDIIRIYFRYTPLRRILKINLILLRKETYFKGFHTVQNKLPRKKESKGTNFLI